MSTRQLLPLVALTMGDVAGVGPEIIARAWGEAPLRELARPLVVGSPAVLERALVVVGSRARVVVVDRPEDARPAGDTIPCLEGTTQELADVAPGRVDARAGRAAYDFLVTAIDLALAGRIEAITTLPLNKEALHAGGIRVPGHTEVLAERCGVAEHAMMLYLPPASGVDFDSPGLGVVHVTLHVALRDVFGLITRKSVIEKIRLADQAMRKLSRWQPRIAVAALNPHAGEGGLFGDEETRIIAPAVIQARTSGLNVTGPIAADTLFARAFAGEFDAVVAMYHDQGHVALKTSGFDRAVNVTLGLPIIRTSVAHGTAYDIAGTGRAGTSSLIEAVKVAARLVEARRQAMPIVRND